MRILQAWIAVLLLVATPAPSRAAAGLRVQPGLWEFTSSLADPLVAEASSQVHRACIRDGTITPGRVMAKIRECRISNAVVKGPAARWKMTCDTPAGPMSGIGSLRATETSVSGVLEMTMTLGVLEIPANSTFRGRRIGNCR